MLLKLILILVTSVAVSGWRQQQAWSSTNMESESTVSAVRFEPEVESIRKLDYKKQVTYASVDSHELVVFLNERLDEDLPQEKLDNEFAAYKILGLGEEIEDIRQVLIDLYTEQVAAFYDQKTRQLVTRSDLGVLDSFNDIILVHELTHALQDQHFNLDKLLKQVKNNNDREMALISLVEGDASLVQTRYMYTLRKWKANDFWSLFAFEQEKLFNAPYFLRENLMFPYTKGVKFATHLFESQSWDGLNRAYRHPPESTEQIMHPEKYSPKRDDPRNIKIPNLRRTLGKGWSLKSQNNLGELNTYILLRKYIGAMRAKKPSRGWGGDWYNYYRRADSDQWALVWDTLWDSPNDAEEFFNSYRKLLQRRFIGHKPGDHWQGRRSELWLDDDMVVYVGTQDDEVLVLHFQEMELLEKAIKKFSAFKLPGSFRNKRKEVKK